MPTLISDNSPILVLSESESLWQELSEWFKGGEEEGAVLLSTQEVDARSVEIIGGGTEGGSVGGESLGFESGYFGDSKGGEL